MLSFDQFKHNHKNQYNMNHDAWQLFYESYLEKVQPAQQDKLQIGSQLYSIVEDFQNSTEGQKHSQYLTNLWSGEQQDLKNLITQLHRQDNQNVKFELVKKSKEEEARILEKIMEHELTDEEERVVKQKVKLSQFNPPQKIIDAQFEHEIRYFYPEKRMPVKKEKVKVPHDDKIEMVLQRNVEQVERKREEYLQKNAVKEYVMEMNQQNRELGRNVQKVHNYMMQQDAEENRARRIKVENYKIDILAQKMQKKIEKIEHIQAEKARSQQERDLIRKHYGLQLDHVNAIVAAADSQQINPQFAKTLISQMNSQEQTQAQTQSQTQTQSKFSRTSTSLNQPKRHGYQQHRRKMRLEHELDELNLKHQFELQMIIKREQLAEVNREKLLSELKDEETRETYEAQFRVQRGQAKTRIEKVMKRQQEEISHLQKTYC